MSDNPPRAATQPMVARIVIGYVKKNRVPPADIPALIAAVHQSLAAVGKAPEPPAKDPAVPIRRSVTNNHVVCLECGWRGHMLRKHIQTAHGLSAEQYRAKWKLSPEHPLTAPAYSRRRSDLAKQLGLGKGARGRPRRRSSSQ
jgi:predicted transcriptional regulator